MPAGRKVLIAFYHVFHIVNFRVDFVCLFKIIHTFYIGTHRCHYGNQMVIIFFANHSGTNNSSRNFMLGYRNFGNENGFSSYIYNSTGAQLGGYATNQTPPSVNSWHHLVSVFENGTYIKMYLDGVLFYNQTSNVPTQSNMPSLPLFFGIGVASQFDFLEGKLDDVGFWNRALTETEITNLYNVNQCITNITVTDTLIINVGQLSFNDPVTWANNITIAPNPASSQININFNNITNLNGGTLKIINSLGQQVATTPITTSGTNSTMQLATWGGTGMYFVQIINPQGQIVDIKKIILQ